MGTLQLGPQATSTSFDQCRREAHETLDQAARGIDGSLDITVTRGIGHGHASRHLLDTSADSDLLIVGSRGLGGFSRLVLGSTSTQCATHARVPVAVIAPDSPVDPVASLLVAFDGSENSIAALAWAHEFAAPGSSLNCVSVWDTTPIVAGTDQFFFPEASDLAEERFADLVERTIEPIRRDDVDVRRTFVNGQPRSTIASLVGSHDILVMGARGRGAIGAAVLGSVSSWLLHHVDQPMVVVPRACDTSVESGDRED